MTGRDPTGRRILVAMSGGVDSTVAAALLAEAGHDVVGVTLKLWGGESDSGCCSVSDVDDARRAAQRLGIDHHVFNFAEEFDRHVVQPYVDAHRGGDTPNPCVECNRHIKFDKLFRRADALGFDLVATGHHARIIIENPADENPADENPADDNPGRPGTGPVWRIARAADQAKDQSYVLHMLDQARLRRLVLPIGDLTKDEVRARAAGLGVDNATKPDSQDVCFIHSKGGREAFLGARIPLAPARVVDTSGRTVGQVASVELVTIGQRRGLDLGGDGDRRYVIDIDHGAGEVTVGRREDLMTDRQPLDQLAWSHHEMDGPLLFQCSAHGTPRPGRILDGAVIWDRPQPRVAPGQSVAIYRDDLVVGGAVAAR